MKETQVLGAILDASSLIIVAKLQEINTLYQVYGPLGIPPAVFREVVEVGKHLGKADAFAVEAAVQAGMVRLVVLSKSQNSFARELHINGALGLGESEALSYAKDTETLLIIEERKGRTLARAYGVNYTILQVFPLEGYIRGRISYEKAIELLDRIAVAMNTDLAVLSALKTAVEAIHRERGDERCQERPVD